VTRIGILHRGPMPAPHCPELTRPKTLSRQASAA
jgi:hypothetical protein